MWPFSKNSRSSKIPVRTGNTESSDPVVSDVIDLRKLKQKTKKVTEDKSFFEKLETGKILSPASRSKKAESGLKVVSHYDTTKSKPIPHALQRILVVVIVLGAGFAALSTVLVSAKVAIQPKLEQFALSKVSVTVDPNLSLPDIDTHRIPGEQIQQTEDINVSLPSTGKQFVQTRAKGTIIITNAYSSSPQALVQRTRFEEKDSGKIYRLVQSITVPGAKVENGKIVPSSIEAEVQADGIGDSYNIPGGSFVIPGFKSTPKFNGFTATTKEALRGGYEGTTRVVSKEDLDKANAEFNTSAENTIKTAVGKNLPPDFIFVDSAQKIEIIGKKSSNVGDPGESVTVTGKVRFTNIAFEKKTLLDFFNSINNGDTARNKKVVANDAVFSYDSAVLTKAGTLVLAVSGTIPTVALLDPLSMSQHIAGKSQTDAEKILRETDGVSAFGIKVFPPWIHTLPKEQSKISIQLLEK